MTYNLTPLTTWAMCDRASALATPVQDDLIFQLAQVGRHNSIATGGSASTDANLEAASAEKSALTLSVAAMAPGLTREKFERKLRRATERVAELTDRTTDFDDVVLTDNEFDRRRLSASLAECTAYLGKIAVQRATLSA